MLYQKNLQDQALDVAFCYGGWDRDLPPGIEYGPVIRDIYIVECCTGGKGGVIINGNHFPIKGGDCYLLCPGDTVIHQADYQAPRTGVWCAIYGLEVAAAFARAGITALSPFAPPEAFESIYRETAALVDGISDTDGGAPLRCRAHIYGILGELLRHTPNPPQGNTAIEKALQMMEACYHEPLPVERMARAAGLERCYFSMQFKQATGQSPHQYLTALRMKKACALIRGGDFSIATIASAVGIVPENFARIFKKEMGVTPLEYRRKQHL
ncbi:MAG: AraC family transcriptional regulator [Clostridiales bacterium]|nr:AraC family transcriptional regulator [Clostridiales bacterium]